MFNTMLADEDSQFHLSKEEIKEWRNNKKTNLSIICQKKGNKLVDATETGKNTLLMYVNWAEDDGYRRLKDSRTLEEENVTLR